jgi:TPR repeat protein
MNDHLNAIYARYSTHSINANDASELEERLAAIRRSLAPPDLDSIRQAATDGDAKGMCLFACALLESWFGERDRKLAMEWFRRAADAGDPVAMDVLAGFYKDGVAPDLGFATNMVEAKRLYRLAAERGFAKSQATLGKLLLDSSIEEAIGWIRKAADQGVWTARMNLARAFETGNGVDQNIDEAYSLYRCLASEGHKRAKRKVRELGGPPWRRLFTSKPQRSR